MIYLVAYSLGLIGNALLVGCEFGLIYLRYARHGSELAVQLQDRFWSRRLLAELHRAPRTLRFARSFFTLVAGAGALGFLVGVPAGERGGWEILGDAFLFIAAAMVFYLLAEVLPRALAIKHPIPVLRNTAPSYFAAKWSLWPLSLLLRKGRAVLFRQFRLDVADDLNPLDAEIQIRALGEEGHDLTPTTRKLVDKAVSLPDLVVADILLPRNQVRWLDLREPVGDSLRVAREAGHTRYPLGDGELDRCIGILHIKDIFRRGSPGAAEPDLRAIARPVISFRLEDTLEEALQRFLGLRLHMALVHDEFGAVAGLVTLERVLEELVGEIQDEFDLEERQIVPLGMNRFRTAGLTPVHDLEEALERDLEEEEVSTVGGMVVAELGRIPEAGEVVETRGLRFEVVEVDERRVILLEVEVLEDGEPPQD